MKTPSDTTSWIDQVTQRTDRWPRHIKSYCNALCDFLEIEEMLSDQRLKQVLAYGDDLKHTYYQQRCDGIDYHQRQLMASTLNELPDWFVQKDMVEIFSKSLSEAASEKLYEKILSKGIIHIDQDGKSSVPVPSLRSFLMEEYGPSHP
ncbi:MAG: hypothetical protein OXC92_05265 [Flavobacteriaceae bacterium]|nr:hypothetical protein [Flavobacteriaceae bacterium]MCY4216375.1 hypothetical protein [Flavobacteriaceae bacterium]MCY4254262.1 hypothetical protein [Flavobacteriaceae bacterium]